MCRFRVKERRIRHIFHQFQNVPAMCECRLKANNDAFLGTSSLRTAISTSFVGKTRDWSFCSDILFFSFVVSESKLGIKISCLLFVLFLLLSATVRLTYIAYDLKSFLGDSVRYTTYPVHIPNNLDTIRLEVMDQERVSGNGYRQS